MMPDPLKPYLATIRIAGYVVLASFLFVGGCNYGKHKQTVKIAELETALGICKDANNANLRTIATLKGINAEYAFQGEKQAKDLAKAQESLKHAEKRIQAREKALTKELNDAYKKNPAWSDTELPPDIKRVFDSASKN